MAKNETIIQTKYTFSEFIARAESRPTGQGWNDASMREGRAFSQSSSLGDAVDIARRGWPEGTGKLLRGLDNLSNLQASNCLGPATHYDVAGELPDVGRYCAGEAEHMMSWEPDVLGALPVVRIDFDGCYNANTKPHQITNQGIALLSCIDELEQSGRAVELLWSATSAGGGVIWSVQTAVKEAGDHFDVDRAAFALAHPAMLRRLWFAVTEQDERAKPLGGGFGGVRRMPQHLRDPGTWYLPSIDELGGCHNLEQTTRAVSQWLEKMILDTLEGRQAA